MVWTTPRGVVIGVGSGAGARFYLMTADASIAVEYGPGSFSLEDDLSSWTMGVEGDSLMKYEVVLNRHGEERATRVQIDKLVPLIGDEADEWEARLSPAIRARDERLRARQRDRFFAAAPADDDD